MVTDCGAARILYFISHIISLLRYSFIFSFFRFHRGARRTRSPRLSVMLVYNTCITVIKLYTDMRQQQIQWMLFCAQCTTERRDGRGSLTRAESDPCMLGAVSLCLVVALIVESSAERCRTKGT